MRRLKCFHKVAAHAPHVATALLGEVLVKVTVEQGYWVAVALGIPAVTVYWLERKGALAFARRRVKRRRGGRAPLGRSPRKRPGHF